METNVFCHYLYTGHDTIPHHTTSNKYVINSKEAATLLF